MRVILDSHSELACGPESGLLTRPKRPHDDEFQLDLLCERFDFDRATVDSLLADSRCHAQFVDAFLSEYSRRQGKRLWAEKTPRNVQRLDQIFRQFPRARFIHMTRDGRDTVCSLRTHPRHKLVDGELVELNTWNPLDQCVARWKKDVQTGLRFRGDPRYIEVRYEDLIDAPETTLRRLFGFLELPWEREVLDFHKQGGASRDVRKFPQNPEATQPMYRNAHGRWRKNLEPKDLSYVLAELGPLLRLLDYELD